MPLAWAASVVLALGLGWLARASLRPAEPVAETHTSLARAPESAPASEPPVSATADPIPAGRAKGPVPPEVLAEENPAAALPAAEATGAAQVLAARAAAPESTAIHGQLTDEDGRPLAGVQVHVPTLSARTATGLNGAYALSLPTDRLSGEDTLTIAAVMVGRETERRPLAVRPGQVRAQDFRLRAASVALQALVVSAAANARSQWATADRATAEQALGHPIRTVPDLPVLGIELGGSGDVPVVRVRQRIGRTGTLVLEQTPEPGTGPVEREVRSAKQPGETELAVRLGGLRVTARAHAPVDTLRA